MQDDEERGKLQAMIETAPRVSPDLEDRLLDLQVAKEQISVPQARKQRYETMRDELAPLLEAEGPRYFINGDGDKVFAYTITPEPIEVDLATLRAAVTKEVYEKVTKVVLDRDAFARAVRRKTISPATFARVAHTGKGTSYVKFVTLAALQERLREDE